MLEAYGYYFSKKKNEIPKEEENYKILKRLINFIHNNENILINEKINELNSNPVWQKIKKMKEYQESVENLKTVKASNILMEKWTKEIEELESNIENILINWVNDFERLIKKNKT